MSKIAVVADVRSRAFFADLRTALDELERHRGVRGRGCCSSRPATTSWCAASRATGARTRCRATGRLVDGIEEERELLRDLRGEADLVLDTSVLNVHELRARVTAAFGDDSGDKALQLTVMSFGYKYGLPVDADLVVDCRFLPNPHWVPELRDQTGRDAAVRDYVLAQTGATEFLDRYEGLVRLIAEGYVREGKRYALLAVGCTGGKHRSVAMSEQLAARLAGPGIEVQVQHRDLGRE